MGDENSASFGRPLDVPFRSSLDPRLPIEVLNRSDLKGRAGPFELRRRQRAQFHQLILCTGGVGVHHVDFEPIEMRTGTLIHIHPGQVQEFHFDSEFDAVMVVYRPDLERTFIPGQEWFPGSDVSTRWALAPEHLERTRTSIEELRTLQDRFDGSPAYVVLVESLLSALLARIELLGGSPSSTEQLSTTYLDYRRYLEEHLRSRPTVTACADQLGYSTRTLDRACQAAVGQTAKEVLGERVALEIRRLLTHTDIPIARVGSMFDFAEASSFSKFVHRHLGASPTEVRSATSDEV